MSLSGTMLDVNDVADVDAAQSHRSALAQSFGIIEIRFEGDARVNKPEVPDMRNSRTPRVRLAAITVIPTRSCDHLSCFWLGK